MDNSLKKASDLPNKSKISGSKKSAPVKTASKRSNVGEIVAAMENAPVEQPEFMDLPDVDANMIPVEEQAQVPQVAEGPIQGIPEPLVVKSPVKKKSKKEMVAPKVPKALKDGAKVERSVKTAKVQKPATSKSGTSKPDKVTTMIVETLSRINNARGTAYGVLTRSISLKYNLDVVKNEKKIKHCLDAAVNDNQIVYEDNRYRMAPTKAKATKVTKKDPAKKDESNKATAAKATKPSPKKKQKEALKVEEKKTGRKAKAKN